MVRHYTETISTDTTILDPVRVFEFLRALKGHLLFSSKCQVVLEASLRGELTLRSHSESSSIRTFFGKLASRREGCRKGKGSCCLKVDTKNLVASLQWQQASMFPNVTNALFCFIENEMLVLHVRLNPENLGFFTYYVPVHFLSEDESLDE